MTGIDLGNFRNRKMAVHASGIGKYSKRISPFGERSILNHCSMIALIGQFLF
jgi:hypothetical protein